MERTCPSCRRPFIITPEDFDFYRRLAVNPPTRCHDCRQQRRLAWRNERFMYKRRCDFTQKEIISMYPPDSPFKVYEQDVWWSDRWDATSYGRPYDFSRPFFEQFRELQLAVPRVALVNKQSENCDYTNHSGKNRNCFMSAVTFGCEDIYYSDWIIDRCRDLVDCSYMLEGCELCYETYYAWGSYRAFYCDFIKRCSNVWFSYDCFNVKNSFLCWNLRNKEYCFRNKQLTKEEYEGEMAKIFPLTHGRLQVLRAEYMDIKNRVAVRPATYSVQTENSVGDLLFESKNVFYGFDSIRVQDCRYIYDAIDLKDSMDVYHVGWAELMYECHAISNGYNCRFCHFTYDNTNATYCDCTQNCKNIFGCVGLNRKEYCILNKQYSKAEYEELVPRIVEHMKQPIASTVSERGRLHTALPDGGRMIPMRHAPGLGGDASPYQKEWGEFFPMEFSPFAYNQSRAQEYYPLTAEAAASVGARWSNYSAPLPQGLPADAANVVCEVTGRPFRILPQEMAFYKKMELPLPRRHPDQRYLDRIAQRNPRKLWERPCSSCGKEVLSSFSQENTARLQCSECYLKTVY